MPQPTSRSVGLSKVQRKRRPCVAPRSIGGAKTRPPGSPPAAGGAASTLPPPGPPGAGLADGRRGVDQHLAALGAAEDRQLEAAAERVVVRQRVVELRAERLLAQALVGLAQVAAAAEAGAAQGRQLEVVVGQAEGREL